MLQLPGSKQKAFAFLLQGLYQIVFVVLLQLLDNMENKMKGTCVEGTIPELFEGKMLVSFMLNFANIL
jgi:hypothetical protein